MGKLIDAAVAVEYIRFHGSVRLDDLQQEISSQTSLRLNEVGPAISLAADKGFLKSAHGENARVNYHVETSGEQFIRRWHKIRYGAYLVWLTDNKVPITIMASALALLK